MSDRRLRERARQAALGDPEARKAAAVERLRAGLCVDCGQPIGDGSWLRRVALFLNGLHISLCGPCENWRFVQHMAAAAKEAGERERGAE